MSVPDPRIIGADDVCRAAEQVLQHGLPALTELLELDSEYGEVKDWQQLPSHEALVSAHFPAGTIISPGLTGTPTRDGQGRYTATWRVAIGIYDRGRDHDDTQKRIRTWCALIRTTLLANRRLGDLDAETLAWVGEEYRLIPEKQKARTFGGGAVVIDVTVPNVFDLGMAGGPLVLSTHPSLTVR